MSILKYKDPITGKWNRITAYGQSGNAVEITEISGETALSDDIITELKNDLNWISYGGGAYRFVSSEEDKRLYSYINEDKISQILVNTLTKTCALRETQIIAASVADSIVKRDSYGEIPVSTPSRDSSATNKAYVDEADKDLRFKLSNLEQALYGYILDTTEEAYADLDSAVLKNSVAVGDNVYPIADKTRALVTRIEGKTTKDENGNIYPAKISGVKFYEKQDKSGEQASVTLPEPYDLHGIGDYKDYLEITKNENNELYTLKKVQSVGVYEYTGNEAWTAGSDNIESVFRYYCTNITIPKSFGDKGICNQYATLTGVEDKEGVLFGSSNVFIYLFLNKTNFPDINSVKSYLSAQYAGNNPVVIYYRLSSPVETVIATNLTYEQVTAIRHNGGLIEVEDNTNKAYAKPTIKNTVVYRLTATNTAEG